MTRTHPNLVIPCMTTTAGVKRQTAHTNAPLCSDPPKRRGEMTAGPRAHAQNLSLMRKVLLLLFSDFAHDRELATLLQSLSVVPPTMYSVSNCDHDCSCKLPACSLLRRG